MNDAKAYMESPTIIVIDEAKLAKVFSRVLDEKFPKIQPVSAIEREPDPLDEYIPKSAVRGKILAASTLWKHERNGNLKTYAIGGKRYYRRCEIQNLIQEVKR